MKKSILIAMFMILSICATACGAKRAEDKAFTSSSVSYEASATSDAVNYGYSKSDMKNAAEKAKLEEAAEYDTAESPAMQESGSSAAGENTSGELSSQDSLSGRKLIKRVDMSVETLEFEKFIGILEGKVTTAGGYIESSSISNNSYYTNRLKYANYTIRIPSEKLEEFVNIVGEYANVVDTSRSTEDVTLSYYDTESRKKALVIQQERLLALLEKAENIEDIIQLESRLSDVTYEMESQSTILRNYDNLVEYSTVSLFINEVERESQKTPESITDKMVNGLTDSLYDIKDGMENFAVFVVSNLPYLLFWAVVIVIVVVILKKKHIIKGKKKEDHPTEQKDESEK